MLANPDFGTSAGISASRALRPLVDFLTRLPEVTEVSAHDPAAEVRDLRDRLVRHGLSKQEIARAIGVDRRSLSGYAKGTIRPASERLELLRTLTELTDVIAVEHTGRVRDILLSRHGRVALVDQLPTAQRTILAIWRRWLATTEATIRVTPRPLQGQPLWASAAQAFLDGRLKPPSRAHAVRPQSIYEMDVSEADSFAEPQYESGRRRRR